MNRRAMAQANGDPRPTPAQRYSTFSGRILPKRVTQKHLEEAVKGREFWARKCHELRMRAKGADKATRVYMALRLACASNSYHLVVRRYHEMLEAFADQQRDLGSSKPAA